MIKKTKKSKVKSKNYKPKVKSFACLPAGRNFCLTVLTFSFLLLTYFYHFSFAQEEPSVEKIPADTIAFIDDGLPEGAATLGEWIWTNEIKFSGETSHTDGVKQGLHSHSFTMTTPIELENNAVIQQYAYLDPDNPPKGIMLKLIPKEGKEIALYWEGEEEVFTDTAEYMEAWYMGVLPETGKWVKLEIKLNELEIAPISVNGMSFITYDGRAYWDNTVILNSPHKE